MVYELPDVKIFDLAKMEERAEYFRILDAAIKTDSRLGLTGDGKIRVCFLTPEQEPNQYNSLSDYLLPPKVSHPIQG